MASKAEKRLERKALKLEKTLEKTARQFADPQPQRAVAEGATIDPKKEVVEPTLAPAQQMMKWDRSMEDLEGAWSWGAERKCCDDHWTTIVHPFLGQCERKKWGEIDNERTGKGRRRRSKHTYYSFDMIIDEAYARLVELKIDDFAPNIFRFRLSGLRRLYGFRVENTATFHMIWFDPEHRLYKQ